MKECPPNKRLNPKTNRCNKIHCKKGEIFNISSGNCDKGIKTIYFFGGGNIAKNELMLCKKLGIDYKYFPVKRRFMGDGKTKVKINSRMKNSVGVTWNLFKKKTKKQENK